LPSSHHLGYMETTESLKYPYYLIRDTCPSRAKSEIFVIAPSDGCPTTATCLASTQALRSGLRRRAPVRSVLLTGQIGNHRSDRSDPPVRLVWSCCISVFDSSVLTFWINQGTQWFSGEPPETLRTWCSLRQSTLMTQLPRSPSSTLVLWLDQETVHDFILLFMPPCGPHLTPLVAGSLEPILLVFSAPRSLTSDDLSLLFFTCTNTS
jgi:hypothetical protein